MTQEKTTGSMTPWGRADYANTLVRGLTWYSTPGHGGLGAAPVWATLHLTPTALALATRQYGRFWYEEDCQCCLVFHEHPEFLRRLGPTIPKPDSELQDSCSATIRQYYPEYFDPEFQGLCRAAAPIPPTVYRGCRVKLASNSAIFTVVETNVKNGYRLEWSGTQYYCPKGRMFDELEYAERPLPDGTVAIWQSPTNAWATRPRVKAA